MRGVDTEENLVNRLLLLLRALTFIYIGKLVALIVCPDLWQKTHGSVLVGFLQVVLKGSGDFRPPAFGVVGHLVESLAIVVVLQLAEGLHGPVEIIVDDGKTVAVGVEALPSREGEVLGVVGQVHAPLQHILAAHGGECVEIHADDEKGIIGTKRRELVVDDLFVERKLVELGKLEVEVVVGIVVECGGIGRIEDGPVGLDEGLAGEHVGGHIIFGHGDVEVADDAFVLLKLQVGPLVVVEKIRQRLLQVVKHARVGSLNLVVVDGDRGIEFLRIGAKGYCKAHQQCREPLQSLASYHSPFALVVR